MGIVVPGADILDMRLAVHFQVEKQYVFHCLNYPSARGPYMLRNPMAWGTYMLRKPFVSVFTRLLVTARAAIYTKGPVLLHFKNMPETVKHA